jgi:ferredoxin
MIKRKIIKIDEEKCNGCGQCIPNCPEGAIQIIDGKARLISDLFCDGLGACIGYCPQGAITIEEREANGYDEKKVMENVVKQGKNVIKAHLEHLKAHNQSELLKQAIEYLKEKNIEIPTLGEGGCPGSKIMDLRKKEGLINKEVAVSERISQLENWPVQIKLVSPLAPYLNGADLLIAADCVPFAYAHFHQDLLKGKVLLVGCPKLDDLQLYQEKISQIVKNNQIKSITYMHMEVPCCFGLIGVIKQAISASGRDIPFQEITISIKGERLK